MFMKTSFSINVSRLVMRRMPASVSWTIPMTGLFAYASKTAVSIARRLTLLQAMCTHASYLQEDQLVAYALAYLR